MEVSSQTALDSDNCHMGPRKSLISDSPEGLSFRLSFIFSITEGTHSQLVQQPINGRGEELRSVLVLRWLTLEQQTFPDASGSIEAVELKGILPAAPPAPN